MLVSMPLQLNKFFRFVGGSFSEVDSSHAYDAISY